jgi:hypothetical protein
MPANETELERLVVRFVADALPYLQASTKVMQQSQMMATKVDQATASIAGMQRQMQGMASDAASVFATFGIATGLKEAFNAFSEFERNQITMKAALTTAGVSVQETMEQYREFGQVITSTTLASKGEVNALLKRAAVMGVTGGAAMSLAKNAIYLGAATGRGAEAGFMLAEALATGDQEMVKWGARMAGLIPRGMHMTDADLMTRVQNAIKTGKIASEEQANTAMGTLTRLGRSMLGVTMEMGGAIAEFVKPLADLGLQAAEWFNSLSKSLKTVFSSVMLVVVGFASWRYVAQLLLPALRGLSTLAAIVLSPWTLLLSAVALAAWVWVEAIGGIEVAWQCVKDIGKAVADWFMGFYERNKTWIDAIANFLRDVVIGIGVVLVTVVTMAVPVWDALKGAALGLWGAIKSVWNVTIGWIIDFLSSADPMLTTIREFTIGFLSAAAGVWIVWEAAGALVFVLELLHARQLLVNAAWLVWETVQAIWEATRIAIYGVVLAVNAFIAVYSAAYAVISAVWSILTLKNAALLVSMLAWLTWKAVMLAVLVVTTTAWLVWKTVVLLAVGVMIAFNAVMTFFKLLLTGQLFVLAAWAVGVAIAKIATWLWNAALLVMNLLLSPVAIIAFIVALVLLGAVLLAVGAAGSAFIAVFVAIGGAVAGIVSEFGKLGGMGAAFGRLGGIFREMGGSLWYVWQGVKAGKIGEAFDLLVDQFSLTIARLKEAFPPFWEFIKTSADATWTYISQAFVSKFKVAFVQMLVDFVVAMVPFSGWIPGLQEKLDKFKESMSAIGSINMDVLGRNFQEAMKGGADTLEEALRNAKTPWEKVMAVENAKAALKKALDQKSAAKDLGTNIAAAMSKGAKEGHEKLQAVLAGSAEAFARQAEYQEKVFNMKTGILGTPGGPELPPGVPRPEDKNKKAVELVLDAQDQFQSSMKGVTDAMANIQAASSAMDKIRAWAEESKKLTELQAKLEEAKRAGAEALKGHDADAIKATAQQIAEYTAAVAAAQSLVQSSGDIGEAQKSATQAAIRAVAELQYGDKGVNPEVLQIWKDMRGFLQEIRDKKEQEVKPSDLSD